MEAATEYGPVEYSALELLLYAGPMTAICIFVLAGIAGVVFLRCLVFRSATHTFDTKDVLLACFFLINMGLCFLFLGIEGVATFNSVGIGSGKDIVINEARLFAKIYLFSFLGILVAYGIRWIRSDRRGHVRNSGLEERI